MAFYSPNPMMASHLGQLLDRLEVDGRPGLRDSIAITWITYDKQDPISGNGSGTGWGENRPLYPASIVKLVYAMATETWLQKDLLLESEGLRNTVKNMLSYSSNDATSLIVDLLTGTTSGPSLKGEEWITWQKQRNLINKWLKELNWPELKTINCCQKTWTDEPYGREKDFYGAGNQNRNVLTTASTARMLEAVMTNTLLSPPACKRIRRALSRSIDSVQRKLDPENQVDGFLGEGLPKDSLLWSKAGLMSQARHDAAWWTLSGKHPTLLVVFGQGRQRAQDKTLLPRIAHEINKIYEE